MSHLEDLRNGHKAVSDAAEESVHAAQVVDHIIHQQHPAARAVLLEQFSLAACKELRVQGLREKRRNETGES